jgi:hypothetical protein
MQCKIGYTGTGRYCGLDSDLDGHPDKTLPCTVWGCYRVSFFYTVVVSKNTKSSLPSHEKNINNIQQKRKKITF